MCPPCYDHNGFVAIHAFENMIAQVQRLSQSHCGDNQESTLSSF